MRLLALALSFLAAKAYADPRPQTEDFYTTVWCEQQQGEQEVRTEQGTRIDCLTDQYAVEVDFDHKWAEGLGQALHYSVQANRTGAVLLILQNHTGQSRSRFVERLQSTIDTLNLPVEIFILETRNFPLRG